MSLFSYPRFVANEFAPMFRLMDDYANHVATRGPSFQPSLRSFQPRFDVKETEAGYELQGELAGVDPKDVEIHFTDNQTLVIKGRTEHSREEGERPSAAAPAVESAAEQKQVTEGESDAAYHKPTVEDEGATASSSAPAETEKPATSEEAAAPAQQESKKERYWVSERSVGQFQRSFSFPCPVDTDNVTAKMNNGVLHLTVPKAPAPDSKRINIE